MQALASDNLTVEKEELCADSLPDFTSESYKDAYSRINAVVIEGEQEAYANFLDLAKLIPEHADELVRLGKMEKKHMNGFCACGRNLAVKPDMPFAKTFFSKLHNNFIEAFKAGNTTTCLLIQCILFFDRKVLDQTKVQIYYFLLLHFLSKEEYLHFETLLTLH